MSAQSASVIAATTDKHEECDRTERGRTRTGGHDQAEDESSLAKMCVLPGIIQDRPLSWTSLRGPGSGVAF